MNTERFDDEMHALLSAYAMGTLTDAQRQRLVEKSIGSQAIFDALMDEETSRAALESPVARRALLNALEKSNDDRVPQPRPSRWLWVAVAASLAVGALSISLLINPPRNELKQVAAVPAPVTRPLPETLQAPPAVVLQEESRRRANAPIKEEPRDTELRLDRRPADSVAAPPPAPAAPPAPAEQALPAAPRQEESKAKKVEAGSILMADSALRSSANAAQPKANAFREMAATVPVIRATPVQIASIVGDRLVIQPRSAGFVYAFVVEGEKIRPLVMPGGSVIESGVRRDFSLGSTSAGAEVWVLLTQSSDPMLERALTGVLPLPNRLWTKLVIPVQ